MPMDLDLSGRAVCIIVSPDFKNYEVIWRIGNPFNIRGDCMTGHATKFNAYLSGIYAAIVAAKTMKLQALYIHVPDTDVLAFIQEYVECTDRKAIKQSNRNPVLIKAIYEALNDAQLCIFAMDDGRKEAVEHRCGGKFFAE